MLRKAVVLRWAGVACLGLAALMAIGLAWPSPRDRVDVSLSGDEMESAWISLGSATDKLDASPVPSLALGIDLPRAVLLGRNEALGLTVDSRSAAADTAVYTLSAEIVSTEAGVKPRGESGQALRAGAAFEWTIVALQAPQARATLLVRLRRHSMQGVAEAERLVLARDIVLPVRTVAGLSAPLARLAAAILGLAGSLLGIASALGRTR